MRAGRSGGAVTYAPTRVADETDDDSTCWIFQT
jgi:hypothetical protein